jgi:hypothetical protein
MLHAEHVPILKSQVTAFDTDSDVPTFEGGYNALIKCYRDYVN